MYIIRNALRNISRSKARNILAGVIVFVIATSSCVALSIRQSAAKAEAKGLSELRVTGQITVDRNRMIEQTQSGGGDFRRSIINIAEPTLDELEKYAGSKYVSDFYYTISSSINSGDDNFKPVDTSGTDSENSDDKDTNNNQGMPGGMGGDLIIRGRGMQGDFSVTGYESESAMTDFMNGTCKITDGEMINLKASDLKCLISNELAAYNSLKAGDKITVANPNSGNEVYTLTVSGVYTNSNSGSSEGGMRFGTSMDPANLIITSVGSLHTIAEKSESVAETTTDQETGITSTTALRTRIAGTYVFKDAQSFEAFKTDAVTMGLSDPYTVTSGDINSYEQSLLPLKNLSRYAGIFLIIVLLIGGIILIVLNIFNIHERKYEVGVLTAIGMKKGKVAMQFVTELFAVTIAAIIIGTAAGSVISVPAANSLLESQISAQESQSRQINRNFGRPDENQNQDQGRQRMDGFAGFFSRTPGSVVEYIREINASTDLIVVIQLLGIGILLTIFSSCAAVVFIMRYEPLKILTSRT